MSQGGEYFLCTMPTVKLRFKEVEGFPGGQEACWIQNSSGTQVCKLESQRAFGYNMKLLKSVLSVDPVHCFAYKGHSGNEGGI